MKNNTKNHLTLTLLLASSAISGAATLTSDFVGTGLWSDAARWSPTGVPSDTTGPADRVDARIASGRNATLNFAAPVVDNVVLLNGGILNIQTGASITINERILLRDASIVNHTGGSISPAAFEFGTQVNSSGSIYNLSGTGIVSTTAVTVGFQPGSGATFAISGSTATITTVGYTIGNNGTQRFTFGATGISTINASGEIALDAASVLNLDLSGYAFTGDSSFTLINAASGLGSSTFGTTNFTYGANSSVFGAAVVYDTANSDVRVQLTAIPEPSSFLLLSGALIFGAVGIRRRKA